MPHETAIKRVLVTGSEGYIGAVLAPALARAGFHVTGLDVGWYADGPPFVPRRAAIPVLPLDVRDVEAADLRGFDAVVHLAGLSNDPLGALDESLTMAVNHAATVRLAAVARQVGVRRFVFSSSCSIYGAGGGAELDETAPMRPLTAYARSKVLAERDLDALATDRFLVTHLRNGTAFGISPCQRFDLVLPNLAGTAHVHGAIRLTSDGSPWRPLVHIEDIARVVVGCLREADGRRVAGPINVGRPGANHRIREIADAVHAAWPRCPVVLGPGAGPDRRTYRVGFERLRRTLPGSAARWTLAAGVDECARVFAARGLDVAAFTDPRWTRLARLREMLATGALDADLRPRRTGAVA